jgi:hypothetical protein
MKKKNIFSLITVTLVLVIIGVSMRHSVFRAQIVDSDTQQAAIAKTKCILDPSKKKHTLAEIVKCLPEKQNFSFKPSIPFYASPFVKTKDLNKIVSDCMPKGETSFSSVFGCMTSGIKEKYPSLQDSALKSMASNLESLLSSTYGLNDIDAATLLLGITQGSPAGSIDGVKCGVEGQCDGSININK